MHVLRTDTVATAVLLNQLKPEEIVAGTKDKFLVQTMYGSGDAIADDAVWLTCLVTGNSALGP